MPKVTHVKKARKDVPGTDIKAGEPYYWWKFRYGGKRYSRAPPRASQLTQSAYLSALYDLQDEIGELAPGENLQAEVENIAERLRELADEQRSNREQMPEQLQDGSTGELLEERADMCEAAADELEAIDFDSFEHDPEADGDEDEQRDAWLEERLEEAQAVSLDG
jgi:hypothetical protein